MDFGFAKNIYPRLPIFLQNAACSYYGWQKTRQRYNKHFDQHLDSFKESEWWAAEKIREYQDKQLRRIVRYAYQNTSFYKNWFDEHSIDVQQIRTIDDLRSLPVLTKTMVRKFQSEMVSDEFDRSKLIRESTSGTTGTPLQVYFTPDGMAKQWAVWWRHKARFGLHRKSLHLSFGGKASVPQSQVGPPYWRKDFFGRRVYLSVYHISKETVPAIVEYLNRSQFEFFTGAASGMYVLSSAMEEMGLTLTNRPKWIVAGADVLLPSFVRSFERSFGAKTTEQYGMSEFAGNMSRCEEGNFHVDFEVGCVQRIAIEGTPYSRLILTGWGNDAMPFIRYEVGDLGKHLDGACPCGRQSECYESIDGRLEDYVLTPDGRRLMGMNQVMQYAKNALEIQIYQPTVEEVVFRVVPTDKFGASDQAILKSEFEKRAGVGISVTFEIVDELERAASGKLRAVISEPARSNKSQTNDTI